MIAREYKVLTAKDYKEVEINNILELKNYIIENETLSKYGDKIQSVNLFLFKKIEDYKNSPLQFSWLDVDGQNHNGVSREAINKALNILIGLKIPFLVFKTQSENCYKIICEVNYKNGEKIDIDEYRQINEKFQKYIFNVCKLTDYEEGSCSPTKGFCLSKNGIKSFNENEKPFNINFEYVPIIRQTKQNFQNTEIQKTEREKFEHALKYITTDICSSFEEWTSCAMALNATFGESGLPYFQLISSYYSGKPQSDAEVEKKYKACSNSRNFSIGTVYHLIEQAGIKIDWSDLFQRDKKNYPAKRKSKPKKKKVVHTFSDAETEYYFQLHSFFSINEFKELLTKNGIDESKYTFDLNQELFVTVKLKGVEMVINQIFADKYDAFTKICTQKHFSLYKDVEEDKFSFNFTAEELTAWLSNYPLTIFRNFEYNRACHSIVPTVSHAEHFDITRTVTSKIENLFDSNINIQDKKIKDFKPRLATALQIFNEDFEMKQPKDICLKQNNGWIDEVLIVGRKYIEKHPGADNSDYWLESLQSIFTITQDDFISIISFIIDSIRVRLYGSDQSMRAMILTGDSGIGKDSFLQGCFTGLNYRKAAKHILKGPLKGATGFSAASLNTMKGIIYNVISDDLSSANNSTNLDTITAPQLPVENKSKDQKFIQKRFNSIITNNDPHVIFGKDKDHNAIARRINFCSLLYAKGCGSSDYKKFYTHYNNKFDEYWAGFFTFCFELEKFDENVAMLADMAQNYTKENLNKLFYKCNDDNRIIDFLTGKYEEAAKNINNTLLSQPNEFIMKIRTKNGEKDFLIIKSISNCWKNDNKFSGEAIKRTLSAHIKGVRFNTTFREFGVTKKAAIIIPCSFFTGETETKDTEEENENSDNKNKTNLIENFKKYL